MSAWILFDDCRSMPARGVLFDKPAEWLTCTASADVSKTLAAAERALRQGLHVAGAFAYELGYALEEKLALCAWPEMKTPLISLGLFERRRGLTGDEIERWLEASAISKLQPQSKHRHARLYAGHPSGHHRSGLMDGRDKPGHDDVGEGGDDRGSNSVQSDLRSCKVTPAWDFADYAERFARVREYIAAGDVYQVNLTFPLDVEIAGDLTALYRDLRRTARSRYGAFMQMPDATILSLSPELFFEIENGVIRTRPMKGTVARAAGFAEDREVAAALARDEKQCAENLMIVDLLRNDLSRIAEKGSVEVEDLFTVETYPTLHTMTSGIRARVREGTSLGDILRAVFPCGSVTGAPKIRAMEIIRALETGPRGVYCGALGWFSGNDARLNVAIRTLEVRDGEARLGVGGGLVYDSQGRDEYDEALLKARFLTDPAPPFSLIETMRATKDGIWLLDRHLSRLRNSAQYFLFPFDESAVRDALNSATTEISSGEYPLLAGGSARVFAERKSSGRGALTQRPCRSPTDEDEAKADVYRLRLLLDADGKVSVTASPMPGEPVDPPMPAGDALTIRPHRDEITIAISPIRTNSADRYLRHKTTRRDVYEREFERVSREGCAEVLFLNERGELTEGSRTTLFIAKNGTLLTPPLACGALDGCLRAELIARQSPPVVERTLTPENLVTADAVYLGNSLRGLMRARLKA